MRIPCARAGGRDEEAGCGGPDRRDAALGDRRAERGLGPSRWSRVLLGWLVAARRDLRRPGPRCRGGRPGAFLGARPLGAGGAPPPPPYYAYAAPPPYYAAPPAVVYETAPAYTP